MEFLIVFLPFLGAIFSASFIRFRESVVLQLLTSLFAVASSILSCILFFTLKDPYVVKIFPWIAVGGITSSFSIHVDGLTSLMFLVVTTVSSVVHFYSIGYMKSDPHKSRFFCYLSLFTFAMLFLVSSADFLQLFFGWEGVGVCSYLLIGFWFKKDSANLAAIKAFIVNRVGDFSFLIGIFAVYLTFNSLQFSEIFMHVADYPQSKILGINAIDFICLSLFIGCMAKSGQFGLHVWLPDAMEGPTPVSALIHAATMVTAGVFLVVKTSFLFEQSLFARNFVLLIGAVTAVFASSIALFQEDIKKIIAYSTCSQLGYMFVACGLSAYNIAIFHLVTHAFFKSLLFLCAGNVIHSLNGEQNIHRMGGLHKRIPATSLLMMVGSFALCGVFPFSGFYSKDLIIAASSVSDLYFAITVMAALLTSLYSFKIIFTVFYGGENFAEKSFHAVDLSMIAPLLFLCVPSVIAGYVGVGYLGFAGKSLWLNSNVSVGYITELHGFKHYIVLLLPLVGILMSYFFVRRFIGVICVMTSAFVIFCLAFSIYLSVAIAVVFLCCLFAWKFVESILRRGYYFNEVYSVMFVSSIKSMSNFFWKVIDIKAVDAIPCIASGVVKFSSACAVRLQTGYIYHYAFLVILGIIFMLFSI